MTEQAWAQRRTSFASAAPAYAAGRPSYPREVLAWAVPDGATAVLDLAAGTGIITQGLLDLGMTGVVAVEPLEEMRAEIPAGVPAMAGSAEAIPLPDESVDAVLVGQAWHWFDAPKATAETRRVLKPGGRLVLMWNLYDEADPTTKIFTTVVDADGERRDLAAEADAQSPVDSSSAFGPGERLLVEHARTYDIDRVIQLALSRSLAIVLDTAAKAALVDRLRAELPTGDITLRWVCEAWRMTAR